jgi:hypothetical protein
MKTESENKTYSSPLLVELGDMNELTFGATSGSMDGNN